MLVELAVQNGAVYPQEYKELLQDVAMAGARVDTNTDEPIDWFLSCAFSEGFEVPNGSTKKLLLETEAYTIRFPDLVFVLDVVDCEQILERWYLKDGKSHSVTPYQVVPDFDPSLLCVLNENEVAGV